MAARMNGVVPRALLLLAAVAAPVLLVGPAPAQTGSDRSSVVAPRPSGTAPTTGTAVTPAAVQPTTSGTREWSGESGSSGHPLMTA
ncbi:MAG: hypothetical protein ACXWU5_06960, partial [Rhodoplanes sp.]